MMRKSEKWKGDSVNLIHTATMEYSGQKSQRLQKGKSGIYKKKLKKQELKAAGRPAD